MQNNKKSDGAVDRPKSPAKHDTRCTIYCEL